jgi:hypothetical protein
MVNYHLGFRTLSIVRYSKEHKKNTGRWIKPKNSVIPRVTHNRQNPLESTCELPHAWGNSTHVIAVAHASARLLLLIVEN